MSKNEEIFRADTSYVADVTLEKHRLSLMVKKWVEGWWCTAIYPDTDETIMLGPDFETLDGAKAHAEDWARLVHRVAAPFSWNTGTPHKEVSIKS